MNVEKLQQKLVAAARSQAPDERVPYAFEKRITALIRARTLTDNWSAWVRGFWRAAISCLAVALVTAAVSYFTFAPSAKEDGVDLSQDFENTMLASVDQPDLSTMP